MMYQYFNLDHVYVSDTHLYTFIFDTLLILINEIFNL